MKQFLLFLDEIFMTNSILQAQHKFSEPQTIKTSGNNTSMIESPWLWLISIALLVFLLALLDHGFNHRKF
jgi:hypothetical protein